MFRIFKHILTDPKRYLTPTYRLKSILDIDTNHHLKGIKYLIIDKDDTLTYLQSNQVLPHLVHKFAFLSTYYTCIIVSNGKSNPTEIQGVPILKNIQKKPYNFGQIEKYLMEKHFYGKFEDLDKVMVIGDRLLTDVYMANYNGVKSILIKELEPSTIYKHGIAVVVLRKLEKLTLKLLGVKQEG